MPLEKFSNEEKQIVLSCLRAIANGPFIKDDWELHSRLGTPRSTLSRLIKIWPQVDDSVDDSDETLAINGVMNEVCNGVYFADADWLTWFNNVDEASIRAVCKKWKNLRGKRKSV